MSDRLTPEWKSNIEEAFGADNILVQRGKQAEAEYFNWGKKHYEIIISHEEDREKQNQGIDFTIKKAGWKEPRTVEIKSNLKKKSFKIDNRKDGWLRNPNKVSDRIIHVDLKHGWVADYRRDKMIEFIDDLMKYAQDDEEINEITYENFSVDNPPGLVKMYNIRTKSITDFIKRKKENADN